jgi:hypothetical protein
MQYSPDIDVCQDEIQNIKRTESRAREELDERLRRMLDDVQACIDAQSSPEPQTPRDMELDELSVFLLT